MVLLLREREKPERGRESGARERESTLERERP